MIKTIQCKLSEKSLLYAAKRLERLADRLERGAITSEITRRVSEAAADEARNHFSADITVMPHDHGVTAVGEQVVFEEFGAGARISDPYPGGTDAGIEIRRGAYSDLYGGEYAQTGYQFWHHDGERYEYVTPVNGLFHGMMKAKDEAPGIIEEVLREKW